MNDEELKHLLRNTAVPEADAPVRRKALEAAIQAYRWRESTGNSRRPFPSPAVRWSLAFACVAILSLFSIQYQTGNRHSLGPAVPGSSWESAIRESRVLLSESSRLFPDNLQAIVLKQGQAKLQTGTGGRLGNSQAVVIELTRGSDRIRIITFSGQRVGIEIEGKNINLEVLVNGEGEVFLVGDEFLWSKAVPRSPFGYSITAQPVNMEL